MKKLAGKLAGKFDKFPINQAHGRPPNQQVVLAWLCYHANARGECWPSVGTLAEECGMSTRSVIRAIASLTDAGLVTSKKRFAHSIQRSNLYKLPFWRSLGVTKSHHGGEAKSLTPCQRVTSRVSESHTEPDSLNHTHRREEGTQPKEEASDGDLRY